MDISSLPTPALVVDLEKVKKNASKMLLRCKEYGVKLRPHFKTSKTVQAAVLQTGGSKRGIVVSTIAEAELLAENGFDDVLYAIPLGEDSEKIKRCALLKKKFKSFHVAIDHVNSLEILLNSSEHDGNWSVFIMVDCGYHRSGVSYDSDMAVKLAQQLDDCEKVTFQGLYTHGGNAYYTNDTKAIHDVANAEVKALQSLVKKLKSVGIKCENYGLGSTPVCSQPTELMKEVSEWHPGNYIFYDLQQEMLGSCTRQDIACVVLTRIIGHYGGSGRNHMLVDCGWTALTTQGGGEGPSGGYGAVADHPELKLESMTQEIGKITTVDGSELPFEKYPVGSTLSILPYHSCATCCMHSVYYVADENGRILDKWYPCRGW